MAKSTLRKIPVSDISRAPFNAESRTTDSRLESLRDEVRGNNNVIATPLVMTADFVLIDGHRRLTIAEEIGLETVPALVYETVVSSDKAEFNRLFKLHNRGNAGYTPKDRLWTVLSGGPAFTTQDQAMAKRIKDILSGPAMQFFMEKNAPRDVFVNSRTAALAIFHPGKKDTDAAVKRDVNNTVCWCLKHGQVQNLKHFLEGYRSQKVDAVKLRFDPADLRRAIDKDRPLKDQITG